MSGREGREGERGREGESEKEKATGRKLRQAVMLLFSQSSHSRFCLAFISHVHSAVLLPAAPEILRAREGTGTEKRPKARRCEKARRLCGSAGSPRAVFPVHEDPPQPEFCAKTLRANTDDTGFPAQRRPAAPAPLSRDLARLRPIMLHSLHSLHSPHSPHSLHAGITKS